MKILIIINFELHVAVCGFPHIFIDQRSRLLWTDLSIVLESLGWSSGKGASWNNFIRSRTALEQGSAPLSSLIPRLVLKQKANRKRIPSKPNTDPLVPFFRYAMGRYPWKDFPSSGAHPPSGVLTAALIFAAWIAMDGLLTAVPPRSIT